MSTFPGPQWLAISSSIPSYPWILPELGNARQTELIQVRVCSLWCAAENNLCKPRHMVGTIYAWRIWHLSVQNSRAQVFHNISSLLC
jgi:hypothetical protein